MLLALSKLEERVRRAADKFSISSRSSSRIIDSWDLSPSMEVSTCSLNNQEYILGKYVPQIFTSRYLSVAGSE